MQAFGVGSLDFQYPVHSNAGAYFVNTLYPTRTLRLLSFTPGPAFAVSHNREVNTVAKQELLSYW